MHGPYPPHSPDIARHIGHVRVFGAKNPRFIDQYLGADYQRVWLGIGHPGHKDRITGCVLGNFAKAEQGDLVNMLGAISSEADWLARGVMVRFINDIALRGMD